MTGRSLEFRRPDTTWMITAAFFALCLHGLCWFISRLLLGDADALTETQRQMGLALAWMVCALAMWRIRVPPTRLHAIFTVMLCALFVTVLGSAAALAKLVLVNGATLSKSLLSSFGMLGGLLILAQLALALPSSILLQGIALTRAKTPVGVP